MYELAFPDIGEGLTEAEVISWLVEVGDEVTANQPIVEVETDKAVVEIPSPRAGVLLGRGAEEGQVIEVGKLLAVIGAAGETWSPSAEAATEAPAAAEPTVQSQPDRPAVRAVPMVRKLADELGVDLDTVTGSGRDGQVTREDVEAAAATHEGAGQAALHGEKLSKLRRTIGEHMTRSWLEIPHVTQWGPAEAARVLEVRKRTKYPIEALVIRAILPVLNEFPVFSANFDGDRLHRSSVHHIGLAVATEAGLMVPVVRDAASFSLEELASEVTRLIQGAQDRTLGVSELRGQTFTISNAGGVKGGYGTPIIPYGTTSILSIGRARDEVIARDGQPTVAARFPLAVSFDHRVIDGAAASQFLNRVVDELEAFSA